jgi:hypothetical protein
MFGETLHRLDLGRVAWALDNAVPADYVHRTVAWLEELHAQPQALSQGKKRAKAQAHDQAGI